MSVDPSPNDLPLANRKVEDVPGHWLLARLGKRVLRPGGRGMTEQMLDDADLSGADVLEIAPGLGKTAGAILSHGPRSYVGVESDGDAATLTEKVVGDRGRVVEGDASATGLESESVDAAIGEAMLTMQTDRHKAEIAAEAFRVLRPGGRYAIHELSLNPDTLADDQKTEIRKALARSIKVNARPLTEDEWRTVMTDAGFTVEQVRFAPMALLEPRRVIADEGVLRTVRFVSNVIRNRAARVRILGMRSVFLKYRDNLAAIEIIAVKPTTTVER
ncbi:methyltransferase domain-containing protein [Gordonia sp. HY002]|uniref:class I SAM-dependent methyltransferase n=1 Tax=Gordonia zhenghanii TaxID=2911516 RepID=UPI001EF0BCAC|nr:class I SAM-dependent methyltransferase [Gordonia zhenghanii]MCF8571747.1 methyltransferase domain-containing protein [Gordonia zhenghanii]MCF8604928.1 methyltransferase domain-containing protein [Gordonia zhenghanii]